MRCLENHDQPRICSYIQDAGVLENLTAMLYFLKGTTLIYGGQEYGCDHVPSLFEKEVFPRDPGKDISSLLATLNRMKKELLSCHDFMRADADDDLDMAIISRSDGKKDKLGVFSLQGKSGTVSVSFPDGTYVNHLDGSTVTVEKGKLTSRGRPIVIA